MNKWLLVSLFALFSFSLQAADYKDITVEDLEKLIKEKKVFIIDVNGAKSYSKGHIPTAAHFTNGKLSKALPKDKETLVVAYCGGPGCGAYKRGAKFAASQGFKNVKHLSAGISGWKKAGKDVQQAKKDS